MEEEIKDVNMQMEIDNQRENGKHSEKWCDIGLKTGNPRLMCSDCQRATEQVGIIQKDIPQFDKWGSKDARISFLSVFSSLIGSDKCQEMSITEIEKASYQIVEELFNKYPTQ